MPSITPLFYALLSAILIPASSEAAPTLVNPAAAFCVESGGFYGTRDSADGKVGVCLLPDGSEVDAWDHLRKAEMRETRIANPAAVFCETQGGTYNLADGSCTLPDGQSVDAWEFLRTAHGQTTGLANPAAVSCVDQGGTYSIQRTEDGETGLCTLPDGSEQDAWALFRATRDAD